MALLAAGRSERMTLICVCRTIGCRYDTITHAHISGRPQTHIRRPWICLCVYAYAHMSTLSRVTFGLLLLVHSFAALAGGLDAMMVSTQCSEVLVTLATVRVDVVNVCGFLWATATGAVLPNPGTPIAVALQDPQASPVPPGWEGLIPSTSSCHDEAVPRTKSRARRMASILHRCGEWVESHTTTADRNYTCRRKCSRLGRTLVDRDRSST